MCPAEYASWSVPNLINGLEETLLAGYFLAMGSLYFRSDNVVLPEKFNNHFHGGPLTLGIKCHFFQESSHYQPADINGWILPVSTMRKKEPNENYCSWPQILTRNRSQTTEAQLNPPYRPSLFFALNKNRPKF